MAKIRNTPPEQLGDFKFNFTDKRLVEMLFRYRARNYPEWLLPDEEAKWQAFCTDRLMGFKQGSGITLDDYFKELKRLRDETSGKDSLIAQLEEFASQKRRN